MLLNLEILEAKLVRFYPDVLSGIFLPDLGHCADRDSERGIVDCRRDHGTILIKMNELNQVPITVFKVPNLETSHLDLGLLIFKSID